MVSTGSTSPSSTRSMHGCQRLLWIGEKRQVKTLLRFFRWFGQASAPRRCASSARDMWKPYLKVIAKKASDAVHVLDRFHIMSHFSKALDEVRAGESKALKAKGLEPVLTKTRWLLLKRPGEPDRKADPPPGLAAGVQPRGVRAYLLKEASSSSGGTALPTGLGASSTNGARDACARRSSR